MERSETLQLMDELEAFVLKQGWPIPLSAYYLIHHEKFLNLMDRLRVSLQDEMDARFINAFGRGPTEELTEKPKISSGKER